MGILQFCGLAVITACLAAFLRQQMPAIANVVVLSGAVLLVLELLRQLSPLVQWLGRFNLPAGESFQCLMKAVGIALASQFARECCKDAGAGSLAVCVELAGRVLIITAALPLFQTVLSMIEGLLQ